MPRYRGVIFSPQEKRIKQEFFNSDRLRAARGEFNSSIERLQVDRAPNHPLAPKYKFPMRRDRLYQPRIHVTNQLLYTK